MFHEARERFLRATTAALEAGHAYLESPGESAREAAYRRAMCEEAAATEGLIAARRLLLDSRGD